MQWVIFNTGVVHGREYGLTIREGPFLVTHEDVLERVVLGEPLLTNRDVVLVWAGFKQLSLDISCVTVVFEWEWDSGSDGNYQTELCSNSTIIMRGHVDPLLQ